MRRLNTGASGAHLGQQVQSYHTKLFLGRSWVREAQALPMLGFSFWILDLSLGLGTSLYPLTKAMRVKAQEIQTLNQKHLKDSEIQAASA